MGLTRTSNIDSQSMPDVLAGFMDTVAASAVLLLCLRQLDGRPTLSSPFGPKASASSVIHRGGALHIALPLIKERHGTLVPVTILFDDVLPVTNTLKRLQHLGLWRQVRPLLKQFNMHCTAARAPDLVTLTDIHPGRPVKAHFRERLLVADWLPGIGLYLYGMSRFGNFVETLDHQRVSKERHTRTAALPAWRISDPFRLQGVEGFCSSDKHRHELRSCNL